MELVAIAFGMLATGIYYLVVSPVEILLKKKDVSKKIVQVVVITLLVVGILIGIYGGWMFWENEEIRERMSRANSV